MPITTDVVISNLDQGDQVYQWLATDRKFSPGPPVSSTNKTDRHDITEILLKVALHIIKQTNKQTILQNTRQERDSNCWPMQSVPITTDVVISNLDQGDVYNIMW